MPRPREIELANGSLFHSVGAVERTLHRFAQASAAGRVMAGSAEAWASFAPIDSSCDSSTLATRDARDRFLPSSHSGASTRASWDPSEVAPRGHESFRLPCSLLDLWLAPLGRATEPHRVSRRESGLRRIERALVRGVFFLAQPFPIESLTPLSIRREPAAPSRGTTCSPTDPRPLRAQDP